MSKTNIHIDKAKFRHSGKLTEAYRLQCNRKNFEKGHFRNLRNKIRENETKIEFKSVTPEERSRLKVDAYPYIL